MLSVHENFMVFLVFTF